MVVRWGIDIARPFRWCEAKGTFIFLILTREVSLFFPKPVASHEFISLAIKELRSIPRTFLRRRFEDERPFVPMES